MFVSRHTSLLSLHTTAVKSPLVLARMSPCFNLSVLGLRSLGIPFLFSLSATTRNFFWAKSSSRSGEEKKLSCTVYDQIILPPCQICHSSVGRCQVLCRPLSVFTEVNIHVICISGRVALFEHFDAETFAFFRYVLF
jgi:hypothetical protein